MTLGRWTRKSHGLLLEPGPLVYADEAPVGAADVTEHSLDYFTSIARALHAAGVASAQVASASGSGFQHSRGLPRERNHPAFVGLHFLS